MNFHFKKPHIIHYSSIKILNQNSHSSIKVDFSAFISAVCVEAHTVQVRSIDSGWFIALGQFSQVLITFRKSLLQALVPFCYIKVPLSLDLTSFLPFWQWKSLLYFVFCLCWRPWLDLQIIASFSVFSSSLPIPHLQC